MEAKKEEALERSRSMKAGFIMLDLAGSSYGSCLLAHQNHGQAVRAQNYEEAAKCKEEEAFLAYVWHFPAKRLPDQA